MPKARDHVYTGDPTMRGRNYPTEPSRNEEWHNAQRAEKVAFLLECEAITQNEANHFLKNGPTNGNLDKQIDRLYQEAYAQERHAMVGRIEKAMEAEQQTQIPDTGDEQQAA